LRRDAIWHVHDKILPTEWKKESGGLQKIHFGASRLPQQKDGEIYKGGNNKGTAKGAESSHTAFGKELTLNRNERKEKTKGKPSTQETQNRLEGPPFGRRNQVGGGGKNCRKNKITRSLLS